MNKSNITRHICIFICIFFIAPSLYAQNDTSVLTFDRFYRQVIAYHPVVSQARLLTEQAKAELRSARGAFDPSVEVDFRNKTSGGNNTYTYFTPELKIPTLVGIDLKGGLEKTSGLNINPEQGKYDINTNSYKGYDMWYGGLSLPLLQGLVFDQRRASLKQAYLLQNLAEAEQIKTINKLLLEAAKDYWDWYMAYQKILLIQSNTQLAATRLNFIKERIKTGEEKPIDSVEASIEYQRREVLLNEAQLDFLNSGQKLAVHLWGENNQPLNLKAGLIPDINENTIVSLSSDSVQQLISTSNNVHPELLKLRNKTEMLNIERKLNIEMIKPRLTVDYIPFRSYTNGVSDGVNNIFQNNYKFGLSFYSPLFLRKERGKLMATNYKLKQLAFETQFTQREVNNAILISYNELQNLEKLIGLQETLVKNSELLRNAEEIRFNSGESSLFLVNQRERNLIETQTKMVELKAKYAKAKITLQWNTGIRMFN